MTPCGLKDWEEAASKGDFSKIPTRFDGRNRQGWLT